VVRLMLAWTILCGLGLVAMIVAAVRDPSPFMVESAFAGGLYLTVIWLIGLPVIALLLMLGPMVKALVAWTALWTIGFAVLVLPATNDEATLIYGPPPIFAISVVIWLIGLLITALVIRRRQRRTRKT
jgi:hypothetical protein